MLEEQEHWRSLEFTTVGKIKPKREKQWFQKQ